MFFNPPIDRGHVEDQIHSSVVLLQTAPLALRMKPNLTQELRKEGQPLPRYPKSVDSTSRQRGSRARRHELFQILVTVVHHAFSRAGNADVNPTKKMTRSYDASIN